MSDHSETEFPVWALQPRAETGATAFLSKYPTFDGRGTVITILDSGTIKQSFVNLKDLFSMYF